MRATHVTLLLFLQPSSVITLDESGDDELFEGGTGVT
jgi:hypothetical protein